MLPRAKRIRAGPWPASNSMTDMGGTLRASSRLVLARRCRTCEIHPEQQFGLTSPFGPPSHPDSPQAAPCHTKPEGRVRKVQEDLTTIRGYNDTFCGVDLEGAHHHSGLTGWRPPAH